MCKSLIYLQPIFKIGMIVTLVIICPESRIEPALIRFLVVCVNIKSAYLTVHWIVSRCHLYVRLLYDSILHVTSMSIINIIMKFK